MIGERERDCRNEWEVHWVNVRGVIVGPKEGDKTLKN